MIELLLVEDNERLRQALASGLRGTGQITLIGMCDSGEDALEVCMSRQPQAILMDVQLAGVMNGIEAAVEIRREYPRMPVVFYSIQDDDEYYRAFLSSGILSHYAYVRKSNYLLPELILPLVREALAGRSIIDPEIASRVQEVERKDARSPLSMLEYHEQAVARLIAKGMSNEQIAQKLGLRGKRSISRTNGQIYNTWGLGASSTDEKIARTRAAIIVREGRIIMWREDGSTYVQDGIGGWEPYDL